MSWLMTNLIAAFLLPPLNLLLAGLLGLFLWHRRPRAARILVGLSLTLLWLLSTPMVSSLMLRQLEGAPVTLDTRQNPADAIVVLGAGTYLGAPEYGTDTVSADGLVRLRYAARLQRETGKPILTSGGTPQGNLISEAEQMKSVLENEFKVPVQWTENTSRNTFENASFSHAMLSQPGIRRIYLVTQAWHMPRAAAAFRNAGFEVMPAPTMYAVPGPLTVLNLLPNASSLQDSQRVMHEVIGLLWYWMRY